MFLFPLPGLVRLDMYLSVFMMIVFFSFIMKALAWCFGKTTISTRIQTVDDTHKPDNSRDLNLKLLPKVERNAGGSVGLLQAGNTRSGTSPRPEEEGSGYQNLEPEAMWRRLPDPRLLIKGCSQTTESHREGK